ncbi:uncharacterized protein LOC141877364 isoform X3 [Acropora palmata]|uniref:uncharacterized protein LOC141877364 isoform X3 n=1 Tax=Acropora palmata TaxID=6131 RepID=UPI003DA11204
MATGSEYTEEQLNFFRVCFITTNELTNGLRTIFKQEWDNRYKTTLGEWKDEAKNGQDFKNGESRGTQKRYKKLLATMINGNRAEWDCTMLFYAILFSDRVGCNLDAVVRSNVDNLREFRNEVFAHLPRGQMSKETFQTEIAKVQGAFEALGLSTAKIQEIRDQVNFPTRHLNQCLEEIKVLNDQLLNEINPFCKLPPKPSHDVAARSYEVAKITQELKQLKETNESRLSYFYISGNPGSGKSQLAGLVAQQIFMESTDAFVMTLNAADLDRLLDSYVSFARHLKCSEYAVTNTLNNKDLKTEEKIAYIKSLAGTKVELYDSWLLLVDNVVSIPEMHAYLPDTGNSHWSKGQLLITTQDTTSIPPDNIFIKQMSVGKGMAPSDATSLLAAISGITDDETAKKVAHALDYQPLALASAATFLRQLCDSKPSSNLGWGDFLEKLDEGKLKNTETFLLNTNASYPYSMTTAIALAVEKSMLSDRVLKHAFNIISLCAPQPLNLDIVTNYIQKVEENSDTNTEGEFNDKDVIGLRICKSSLLLLEEDNSEIYVRIHQVERDVIQRLIKQHWETQRFEVVHVSILSLNQFIVDRKTDDYTANGFRLVVPHLRFLSKQVEAIFKENDSSKAIKKIFNLKDYPDYFNLFGTICSVHFDLITAKRFASLALKLISHDSMPDHSYAASAHSLMGKVLYQMGTFEEGKRHFKRSLALQLQLLGSEHPDVAGSYNDLATVLRGQGHLKQAKEYHERALAIWQQTSGPQHPDVATSYNNLAIVLDDQGDLMQAKEYHERALAIRQKTLGPQHPDVASSYNNLANVLRDQGDLQQAMEYHERSLAIMQQTLGPQHPDVASSYSNLATVLHSQGDLKQAKEYHERALAIMQQTLGPQHPDVASSYNNLANVLSDQGDLMQAKEYHERALAIRQQTLGPQHPDVASSYNNLANVLSDQGDLKQAKEYYERALAIRQQTLGPQHPDVAMSYNDLAIVLRGQGDLKQAKEYLERALAIRQQTLGPQHPDVAMSYNNIASVLQYQAEADKTEIQGQEYYEQGSDDDVSSGQTSETREEDLPHEIHKLQLKEEPDKVAIFEGTVTSEGFHLDLNAGAIHLTFPPDTVAEPTDIMVYKWKYGACLPQLTENEAVVSNVIEISAVSEVGGLKFNSEVKVVLSHSAAGLEGYEVVLKRLTDKETNEWEETAGCDDIRQVSDLKDDYPCPNNVPYCFPVVRAGITECSSYAVVSRLKLSPKCTITVNGGTFAHLCYPQVTITVPQKAVATETRLSLELKGIRCNWGSALFVSPVTSYYCYDNVQEVPQDEFQRQDLFCGPILRVLCSSKATFLEPVTIQLPLSLGNKVVNLPQPSDCRVRIFFLSPERESKEWVEISDKLESPASYDGKLVKFKVQRFSGYAFLLDWTIIGSGVVTSVGIIAYLSSIIWKQPLVANFFAYFDPKERINSRDILFLICCPAHQCKDVKQELEKAGLTSREATSRRYMIPGRDKAFVFVSGGITFASDEDMGGFYLRFYGNVSHKAQLQVRLVSDQEHCKVEFRDTPDTRVKKNLLSTLNFNWSSSSIDRQIFSVSSASVAPSEEAPGGCSISTSSRKLKVTLLSIEWGSTKGGLSTINRELAIQLAKYDNVEVCMYLPEFSDKDQKEALDCRVSLLKAEKKPGYDDPIDWLASVPRNHPMDIVIGHGIHLGRQVPHIKESYPECKWVQVVHTDPEELAMFKTYRCPIAKGEKKHVAELELCKRADQVVAIGPKLADTCSHYCENEKILVITPGIFSAFSHIKQETKERRVFHVLVFGRGDIEDFEVKGYDIATQAVANLKDEEHPVKLVFVGAPTGKEEQITKMLLDQGISRRQLIVRSAKERKELAQEFKAADLVIMPSRTEGFGLSALEALSAGLPVRVSRNSGFGQALKELTFGENVLLNSDDLAE